jgi:hypothetical protein
MKKIFSLLLILLSFAGYSQSIYTPVTSNAADSIIVPSNVAGAVRKVYNIDLGMNKLNKKDSVHTVAGNYVRQDRLKDALDSSANANQIYVDTASMGAGTSASPIRRKLTITTTGTSGPAAITGNTLNIPQYSGGGSSDSIRVAAGDPTTGNVYISSVDNRLHYKSGSYWYRVAVQDSSGSYTFTNTEAAAYFTRLATAGYSATNTEKTAYDNYVTSSKSDGYFTSSKVFRPFLGSSTAAGVLNAISSSFDGTITGSVTFGSGGAVMASNGYLIDNLIPSTSLTLNSTAFGVAIATANSVAGTDMGAFVSNTQTMGLAAKWSDNFTYANSNDNGGSFGISLNTQTSNGRWLVNRSGANSLILYKNGASVATNTGTNTGTLPNVSFVTGAKGAATVTEFTNRTYKASYIFSPALTPTQAAAFDANLSTFLTAIGR